MGLFDSLTLVFSYRCTRICFCCRLLHKVFLDRLLWHIRVVTNSISTKLSIAKVYLVHTVSLLDYKRIFRDLKSIASANHLSDPLEKTVPQVSFINANISVPNELKSEEVYFSLLVGVVASKGIESILQMS